MQPMLQSGSGAVGFGRAAFTSFADKTRDQLADLSSHAARSMVFDCVLQVTAESGAFA